MGQQPLGDLAGDPGAAARMTARQVVEDIANFPLQFKSEEQSWSDGYAAWRNQQLAREWLRTHPTRARATTKGAQGR